MTDYLPIIVTKIKNTLVVSHLNIVSLNQWRKHEICIIMVIFLTVFHYTLLSLLFVHSIMVSFTLLEIHYLEEVFHGGITHIILLNKNLPFYDTVRFSLLYAMQWIRLTYVI